ncbi:hypothetical protein OIU76_021713 [Salix suchowensis]|nr:hypothetical protein OIU76_021713 [Salix suchowensis]
MRHAEQVPNFSVVCTGSRHAPKEERRRTKADRPDFVESSLLKVFLSPISRKADRQTKKFEESQTRLISAKLMLKEAQTRLISAKLILKEAQTRLISAKLILKEAQTRLTLQG